MPVFLALMVLCDILIYAPFGAVLGPEKNTIHLGIGYQIASVWLFASFTYALVLGYVFFRRVWRTDKQTFVLGLLLFATVGYAETVMKAPFMNLTGPHPSEPVFQSFEFPLAAFAAVDPSFNPATLTTVRFIFDRTPAGAVILDGLGIRK